jgi:iron complex outermembrane receptor protein
MFQVRLLTLVALTVLLAAEVGSAQTRTAIEGSITDENSAKIVGAQVYLRSRGGPQLSTTTDRNGAFGFTDLGPNTYLLEVKADGFSSVISDEIILERGATKQLQLQLKVAALRESVVITATGTAQRVDEVAKALSILDSDEIEARHTLSLTETMRGTPGIRIQQQGSPGALSTVRLRGLRPFDTALLLDGLRVRDASDINGSAVSLFTDLAPIAIDRVEVLRGSGSSIYGTNAIGGVINLVPITGTGRPHFEAGFEGGSLATYRERFQGAFGNTRFGSSFAVNRTDVRRGIDGQDEYGSSAGGGRFQFNVTPSIALSGNLFGTIANARVNDSPFALAAAFSTSQQFPRAVVGDTFQPDFNNPDQGRRNRLLVGSVKLTHQINDTFSYSIAYQRVLSDRRNYNGPAIDPAFSSFYLFGDFEFINVNEGTTDTIDARLHAQLGRSNLATVGVEFESESLFQHSRPSFSAFNDTTDRQRTFAIFGQDQLSLIDDRLQLSVAVRGQFFRIHAADRPDFLGSITAENSITGDGAVAYFIRSTNTKLRAHAGNGLRAPSLFERFGAGTFPGAGLARFGDPTLRAEQSISVDGGVDQRLAGDRVLLGATYFYTRLQRAIAFKSFVNDPLGLGRFSGYQNEPGGLARGLETFMQSTPFSGTSVNASYTFTNSDRVTTARGLLPEYVIPKHLFGLSITQRYRSFLVNLEINHTGEYLAPVFENNFPFRMAELTFSGYTKADLFASYERRFSEGISALFFGGVENLANQDYFENGFRAPGILGRGGVKLRF